MTVGILNEYGFFFPYYFITVAIYAPNYLYEMIYLSVWILVCVHVFTYIQTYAFYIYTYIYLCHDYIVISECKETLEYIFQINA